MRQVTKPDIAGRGRALKLYPNGQPCEVCGKPYGGRGVVDRHHRNSNRMDNSPENIAWLCRKHHNDAHRLSDGKIGGGPRPRIAAMMRDRAIARYRVALVLRESGLGVPQIAQEMGVTQGTVYRWWHEYEGELT